jgi:energy-coupling factor transporter transmembrane protein EcfT
MLARGYRGAVPRMRPLVFARADAAFVAIALAAPVTIRLLGGVA